MKRAALVVAAALAVAIGASPASASFPGAPRAQHDGDFVSGMCPVATRSRYLPPRAGCVGVAEADVNGDGRPDLVILYSRLTHEPASRFFTGPPPPGWNDRFLASAAFVRIVLAGGNVVTTRVRGARATALLRVFRVGRPGAELMLQVGHTSSGNTAESFGLSGGRLAAAGPVFGYGGDSGAQAGFSCLPGRPPRLVQRVFVNSSATISGVWRETLTTYAWHGPRLVRVGRRTFGHRGFPARAQTAAGSGCGVSAPRD